MWHLLIHSQAKDLNSPEQRKQVKHVTTLHQSTVISTCTWKPARITLAMYGYQGLLWLGSSTPVPGPTWLATGAVVGVWNWMETNHLPSQEKHVWKWTLPAPWDTSNVQTWLVYTEQCKTWVPCQHLKIANWVDLFFLLFLCIKNANHQHKSIKIWPSWPTSVQQHLPSSC